MAKEYLQGKVGTGIRAAWVGEKTTTSFAIYVLVRNMSTQAWNNIYDASGNGIGLNIDKTTNVTVRVTNLTTGGFADNADASGNITIADLESDPLVWADASGNALPSTDWYGLRIRRFAFTGLSAGAEYSMQVFTDAVNAHAPDDVNSGRCRQFSFNVRTLKSNFLAGASMSCDGRKWVDNANVWYAPNGDKPTWFDLQEKLSSNGCDIFVCQDDLGYDDGLGALGDDYIDPVSLTSDVTYAANQNITHAMINTAVLDVEEVASTFDASGNLTDADDYWLVQCFMRALVHPPTLIMGMQASIESTDSGDHLGNRNNSNFHFVDLGTSDPDIDRYTTDVAGLETDLEYVGQESLNHQLLLEYFFGRATGATPPATDSVRAQYSNHPNYGGSLALDDFIFQPNYRKREHPLVDIFYLNCTHYSDVGGDGTFYSGTAGYPTVAGSANNKTLGTEQLSWLTTQLAASTKDFIIIMTGDPLLPVLSLATAGSEAARYGQADSIGYKSATELASVIAALQATGKGVLILTGDHHCQAITWNGDNLLQGIASAPNPAIRPFEQLGTGYVGQATDSGAETVAGFIRFVVTPGRMYAYVVELSSGNPLGSSAAYFEAGGSVWRFIPAAAYSYDHVLGMGNGLASIGKR